MMKQHKKQRKVIMIDPNKCTGCHSCEMACSLEHFNFCGPHYSRIRIEEFRDVNTFIPVVCQGCDDAICIKYCPTNARVCLENGAVVTDPERCIGCRACLFGCPFGAINIDPLTQKTMTCDLCRQNEEGPACVRACTMQKALRLVDFEECGKIRSREWARVMQKEYNPPSHQLDGEKRAGYGIAENKENEKT